MRGMALAAMGKSAEARAEAQATSDLTARRPFPLADYAVACTHAILGSNEEAMIHLKRALESRALSLNSIITPAYIRDDPILAPLRSDPRFKTLIAEI